MFAIKWFIFVITAVTLTGCAGTAYTYGGANPNFWEEFSAMQKSAREDRAQRTPAEDYANDRPLILQTHRSYAKTEREVYRAVVRTFTCDHSNSRIHVAQGITTVEWTLSARRGNHIDSFAMKTHVFVSKYPGQNNTRLELRSAYLDRENNSREYLPNLKEIDARLYNFVEFYLNGNEYQGQCR